MIQKLTRTAAFFLLLSSSAVFARGTSYTGFSLGLMPDLGNLGKTITIDGLDSALVGKPSMIGASPVTGCQNAPNPTLCKQEVVGDPQSVIVPENELIALQKNTGGIIQSKTSGPMTGLVANLFYEWEGDSVFYRVGFAYNKKILGGDSESSIAGVKWYDIHWDYKVLYIPAYIGLKAGMGETSSVYAAVGLNYHQGGWDVGGRNAGSIPTTLLGSMTGTIGTTSVIDANGQPKGGDLLFANGKFRAHGIGFAMLVGVERKLANGNKWFIEINQIFAGEQGTATAQDVGLIRNMSPFPTYPVILAGTFFNVGYKVAM